MKGCVNDVSECRRNGLKEIGRVVGWLERMSLVTSASEREEKKVNK